MRRAGHSLKRGGTAASDKQGAPVIERYSLRDRVLLSQGINIPGGLARVTAGLALVFLEMVDVLDNGDRDDDIVRAEFKKRLGVVEHDRGVEYVVNVMRRVHGWFPRSV